MYVIYEKRTTRIQGKAHATLRKANNALKRMIQEWPLRNCGGGVVSEDQFGIAEQGHFHEHIERQVQRTNLMTGKPYMEPINTPGFMSPASEAYWSM